jgi:hypothetical protein
VQLPTSIPVRHAATAAANGGSRSTLNSTSSTMRKTLDTIVEAVRNPKHPFRKTEHHPKKALKHRYERRKIKAWLQLSDWQSEEMA